MNILPELLDFAFEEKFPRRHRQDGVQSLDQLIEYSCEQGDSASGHAWNDICRSHCETFQGDSGVFDDI